MEKKRMIRYLGILLVFIGVVITLNSFQGITGFAIYEGIFGNAGQIIGIVFLFFGILLLIAEGLEDRADVQNVAKYPKLKSRYIAPSKLEGEGIDLLDYLSRENILFEREYLSVYPKKEGESKEDFQKRIGYALSHRREYPKIISKVDAKLSKIRDYISKLHNKDFLTELRRHADDEVREAYFEKFLARREEKKGLRQASKYDNNIYKSNHYKNFRKRSLDRIKNYNEKVKNGEWVLIDIEALNSADNKKFTADSYSQVLYFGPKDLAKEIEKKIKTGDNEKKIRRYLADKARKTEIGEAHMIADADNYSHLHWEIRNIKREYL